MEEKQDFFLFLSSCITVDKSQTTQTPPPEPETQYVEIDPDAQPALPPTGKGDANQPLYNPEFTLKSQVDDLPYAVHYGEESKPRVFTDKMFHVPEQDTEDMEEPVELPVLFEDDMSRYSLLRAIDHQLNAFEDADLSRRVQLGPRRVTRRTLRDTLAVFRDLLQRNIPEPELSRAIRKQFEVIEVGREVNEGKQALFTGYYTPIMPASRHRTGDYIYPLYRNPDGNSLQQVGWKAPDATNRDNGYHLNPAVRNRIWTRQQIDGEARLDQRDLEIAWLKDDLDRYFLHIQGSGYLSFQDGSVQAVRYDGSNGLPYTSIGRQMIHDGAISEDEGSMQGIKAYFRQHPEKIRHYLFQNRRYIFFELSEGAPLGSGGTELVPGRSMATDKSLYPAGGLAFLAAHKPLLDANDRIVGWQPFSRFVIDQDTGSAIQGPGRADLYFGVGETAGAAAGHYYQRGKMLYLILK